jgi:hypothetical protein
MTYVCDGCGAEFAEPPTDVPVPHTNCEHDGEIVEAAGVSG